MVLARTIYRPLCPGEPLLKSGFRLDQPSIKRLKNLHISSLWVKYPRLAFLDGIINPVVTKKPKIF
jgi:hypothetical protein